MVKSLTLNAKDPDQLEEMLQPFSGEAAIQAIRAAPFKANANLYPFENSRLFFLNSDPIRVATPPPYSICAVTIPLNYGFNTNAHSLSFGSNCRESYRRDSYNYTDLLAEARNQIVGSKCDFTVFEPAKLKNGFVFKSFTGRRSKSSKADIELKSSPSSGGTSVKFVLHGWADPGNYAIYHIESITLEGPAGRDWRDALH